jgi:putative FmdB family regulatory protein
MPTYLHVCGSCNYEWEQEYSIKEDPPKICPSCNCETVKRLISLTGKGIVELSGNDLVSKCKSDAQKIKKEISNNEYKYASILGEDKYNNIQTSLDRRRKK